MTTESDMTTDIARLEFVRAETAAIYGTCLNPQQDLWERHRLMAACRTLREMPLEQPPPARPARVRKGRPDRHLTIRERREIEVAIARTGSIAGAMAETGCAYELVRRVWTRMAA